MDKLQYLLSTCFSGAIFDLDGVIVDTAGFHYLAWKELAEKLGFIFTREDNERLKGVSRAQSLKILLEIGEVTLSERDFTKALEDKNARYLEYINALTQKDILPGAEAYIRLLRQKGVRIALGSASKNAPLILRRLGITDMFDAICDGNCVSRAKPDPEVFIKAAVLIDRAPTQCVVFEDAEAGIEAAKTAGMFSVGIGNALILKNADIVIDGLSDIIEWQKNHCSA